MKKLILVLVLLISILLTSCFSYQDINRVIFVTALVIDVDDQGEPIIYAEAFHSYRSNETNTEKGERLTFQIEGTSIYDAFRKFNNTTSYRIDYTQNKVIIFTEQAAKYGITPFLDILERNQELIYRSHILVLANPPEELMNLKVKQDEYIGLYLYEMMDHPFLRRQHYLDRLNVFLNYRLIQGETQVVSMIEIKENSTGKIVVVADGAIFQNNRLVGRMDQKEMKAYKVLINKMDRGLIIIPHLYEKDKHIILDSLSNKTKTDIVYDGNKIILKKKIEARTSIGEIQSPLILNKENEEKIEELIVTVVKDNCNELFNKMKELNYDIFDVALLMERKYPKVEIENPLAITELQLEVENYLEGSSNVTNFR